MRYYIEATTTANPAEKVWVHKVSGTHHPESLTFRPERAHIFDTLAGADMDESLRLARAMFSMNFRVVPLCPTMPAHQFNHFRDEIDSGVTAAYYDKLVKEFGPTNAAVVLAMATREAKYGVPAIMNADVLSDYSMKLGGALVRHIHAARTGNHELAQNKAS